MASIRLRVFLNMTAGGRSSRELTTKRQLNQAAAVIVQNVALSYADGYQDQLVGRVQQRVGLDVQAEISEAAMAYKRIMIGHERGPGGGRLTPAADGYSGKAFVPGQMVSWTPRSPKYLARKRRALGHTRWLDGWTGYLGRTLGKGSEWTDIFGPIRVAVRPGKSSGYDTSRRAPALGGHLYRPTDGSKEVRVHIGSVEVTALERITVAMLRSYSKSGVPAAVAAAGYEELAHHLAGPSYYRPSLEPFLDFVLTRSIPHAVKRRVEMGLNDRIGRDREYGRRV